MGLNFFKYYVFFAFYCSTFSQNDSIIKSTYIKTFQDKISTRASIINTSNSFYIYDKESGDHYILEPNKTNYLGFSILFRSIEIDYGFSPNFLSENKDNKDSRLFTFNSRMFYNQWMQTIDFYNQKGFYFKDESNKVELPGVKSLKVGGSTSYIFNKNFSFRAIGFQNEWQIKSAGSFIPRLYYYYTKYKLEEDNINEKANTFNIAIAPSYYYNLAITKNILFSLGGSAGIGVNHSNNLGSENLTSALFEFTGRAVISYNSDSFFGGINSNIVILKHNVDKTTRQDDEITYLEFYIGYRFKAPKKWINFADNFNEKYGL
ncbi:DUF4421 family protein [Formosa maritima]|uniref:DUF4421 family protein n=1 Tax=Formosa maritima TaxID=2592046 RepID=UPI00131533BF|nr:DUF4421 family protein [Formosa maritima]